MNTKNDSYFVSFKENFMALKLIKEKLVGKYDGLAQLIFYQKVLFLVGLI